MFAAQLQNRDDLPIEPDEWTERLMSARHKDYVIHDVLPTRVTTQKYLKHHFPTCEFLTLFATSTMTVYCVAVIGEHGFILIIRHYVDEEKAHDHILHDCAWPEGDCRCELIRKKIQPQRANRQVIARNDADRSFFASLLHTLKLRNVIWAYSDSKLHINVSEIRIRIFSHQFCRIRTDFFHFRSISAIFQRRNSKSCSRPH